MEQECVLCFSTMDLHEHHRSYYPPEIILLCKNCHFLSKNPFFESLFHNYTSSDYKRFYFNQCDMHKKMYDNGWVHCCKRTPKYKIEYDGGSSGNYKYVLCEKHYNSDPAFQRNIITKEELI